ncbi:MAG: riboflavin synthase [Kineosporiaceae bacterium]
MFTGIVEECGAVVAVGRGADSARVTVRGPVVTAGAGHGDSIAVNGVCLTVTEVAGDAFTVDVMAETLRRSSLAAAQPGAPVNLERAMPADGRFGGHVVQGHVDGTGTVLAVEPGDRWVVVRISLPAALRRYVVEKGSIAVDGVSLTVAGVGGDDGGGVDADGWFTVSLIPTTLEVTTFGARAPGDVVNLEVDVLAKYVEAQLAHLGTGSVVGGAA